MVSILSKRGKAPQVIGYLGSDIRFHISVLIENVGIILGLPLPESDQCLEDILQIQPVFFIGEIRSLVLTVLGIIGAVVVHGGEVGDEAQAHILQHPQFQVPAARVILVDIVGTVTWIGISTMQRTPKPT